MNEAAGGGLVIMYLVFIVIFFIIGVLVLRWMLGTDKMIKSMNAQTELLSKIAKLQGAGDEEINAILKKYR